MGLRIRKSVRIVKGVNLNLSGSGVSVSGKAGPVTLNSRGRASVRIAPGVSYQVGSPGRRGPRTVAGPSQMAAVREPRPISPAVYWWTALLGGWMGVHRFYRGQILLGLLYALTFGLLSIGWIVDAIIAFVVWRRASQPVVEV